ncbi:flippase [Marinomonas sp.]|uniref:flippase n=1 Tax=Marinomonas sp. TaxID=1904862 RepID=UPI003A8F380D
MIKKIKTKLNGSIESKRLISNIFSLATLQGVSYILPLLTFPYLIRILGADFFGLLAFATATITYFMILTDYGFDLSATRQVSIYRDDKVKINEIYSSVMIIKVILAAIGFGVLVVLVLSVERMNQYFEVYFITFGVVVGRVLFPVWLFQGMEKMKFITYLNIAAKVFFAICIFIFVHQKSDYWMVPLFTALGFIVSGIFAQYLVRKQFDVSFHWQSLEKIKCQLMDGWHVFLSRIYVNLYSVSNIIILGIMTGNTIVGYYSIAEKIMQAISGLFQPILQAFYPYLSKLYSTSKKDFYTVFKRLNVILFFVSLFFTALSVLYSEQIVLLVSGDKNLEVVSVFSILAFSILTSPFGPSYTNGLLAIGENRQVSRVVRNTLYVNFIVVGPLIYYYQAIGLAMAWVFGQLIHVLLYLRAYQKAKRQISPEVIDKDDEKCVE